MHLSQFPYEFVITRSKVSGYKILGDKSTKIIVNILLQLSHLIIITIENTLVALSTLERLYWTPESVTIFFIIVNHLTR